jgi:diacylglycerol kinase (ATP)
VRRLLRRLASPFAKVDGNMFSGGREASVTVGVVWNPTAGAGRMKRRWPRIRKALQARFPDIRFEPTAHPGHAGELASTLVDEGAELIIAVGGDGTLSEVADGLLSRGTAYASMVGLATVPLGTGADFARGLGLVRSPEVVADRIVNGMPRPIDAGRMDYDIEDAPPGRHFINVASVGVSAEIADSVERSRLTSRLRGRLAFYLHTVCHLMNCRFPRLRVRVDGDIVFDGPAATVVVANGRWFGGGMMIAPKAEIDDGRLDIIVIKGRSRLELLKALGLVYTGRHVGHPACAMFSGRLVNIDAPDGDVVGVELDGALAAELPVRFEVLDRPITFHGA